jgi:ankyrin repeat protein
MANSGLKSCTRILAVLNLHPDSLFLLGTPEVRVDILDVEGKTPLSWAIIRKQGIVLGLLLNRMGLPCDKKTRQTLLNRGGGLATTKTGNVLPSYKAWQSPL